MWTLDYLGTEKALSDWGICEDFSRRVLSKGKTTATFLTVEDFDSATPQFAFDEPGIIWRDRTSVGVGGTKWFQGNFDSPKRITQGGKEHIQYQLHNAWWYFERHMFQQTRQQFAGFTDHDPTKPPILQTVLSSESYLGELPDETLCTNGVQIEEIVDWLNTCYFGRDAANKVTLGDVDPQVVHPRTRTQTLFCSEAIFSVLRSSPDAVLKWDYTTTPPTLHFKSLVKWNYGTSPPTFVDYTNLPEVSITLTARQEKEVGLQAADMRKLPGVIIKYKSIQSIDGKDTPQLTVDKYPPAITDYTPEISSHVVTLPGLNVTHFRKNIETAPIAPSFSSDPEERKQWWKDHDKTLQSERVDDDTITVPAAEFVDADGLVVDTDLFPNELLSESLPEWTNCRAIKAYAKADLSFRKFTDASQAVPDTNHDNREVRHKLTLTNAVTKLYEAIEHSDPGIAAPAGLAEGIYRAVAPLMHAGSLTLTETQLASDIFVGCRLKLIGPNNTYTNLLVQGITERPHIGEMTVEYGPSAMIDADQLIELALATRWRTVYDYKSGRSDGSGESNADIDSSATGDTDNTAHGPGGASHISVSKVFDD